MSEQEKISRGTKASMLIDGIKDVVAAMQAEYVSDCALAARNGQDANVHAMKLAVLDDIVERLIQDIATGRKAQQRVERRQVHNEAIRHSAG